MIYSLSPKIIGGSLLTIYSYGLCIMLGIIAAYVLLFFDHYRKKIITMNELGDFFVFAIIVGIIGGRIGEICIDPLSFTTYGSWFSLSYPGFSITGTIVALIVFCPWYLYVKRLKSRAILDLIGVYAPLVQAFGRIGCLTAGCCHGLVTTSTWLSIQYTHQDSYAECGINYIPTQLISAFILCGIFVVLYSFRKLFFIQPYRQKSGLLFGCYLVLSGLERFALDFWRADHEPVLFSCSSSQWLALLISVGGLGYIGYVFLRKNKIQHSGY
jgi:phosphatidylglycerol:prolipoprotein diacylglycerol transferase